MRYMLTFKADEEPKPGLSACKQYLPEMAKLMGELTEADVIVSTEALLPSSTGARLTYSRGTIAVTDGPFAEAKEIVAGFCVVNVKSKAEAVELGRKFLTIAGEGRCEILEVFEHSET
ncbi:MAG TPA: YciI family protein [Gemmataceae bacterium]|jgi:hypothetical protein|nr:YciI family protein [Gemmataceae bacterium]